MERLVVGDNQYSSWTCISPGNTKLFCTISTCKFYVSHDCNVAVEIAGEATRVVARHARMLRIVTNEEAPIELISEASPAVPPN